MSGEYVPYKPQEPRKANFLAQRNQPPKNQGWHENSKTEETKTGTFSKAAPNKSVNSERRGFLSKRNQAPSNEKSNESSKEENGTISMVHGPLPLKGIYKVMDKSGLSGNNSEYYNAVVTDLSNVINSWNVPLSGDMAKMQNAFTDTENYYSRLISSCKKYLKRRAFSSRGKARQEIIENILEQAEIDKHSIKNYFVQHLSLPESERAKSVEDALAIARRKVLIMGKADFEYKHVGGKASHLTVFEEGDLQGSNASGFFKAEEKFTNYGEKQQYALLEILERARKVSPISDSLYQKIYNYIYKTYMKKSEYKINNDSIDRLSGIKEDSQEFSDFKKTFNAMCKSWAVVKYNIHDKGSAEVKMEEGESISLTNRNVASSRMAEALGVGNLIAKSETVEMREPGQKKGRIGNLMQKAEGQEASKYRDKYKSGADNSKKKKEASDKMAKKMTGNFQKQIASLQVLDYLMGQVDRHNNNYFIQENDKGELDNVTGIDNDLSFGDAKIERVVWGFFTMGNNGRSPVDTEGNFILPHMDKAFAERILAFTGEQLTFLLGDLIEKKNIDFACKRLSTLQNAIRKKMEEDREKEGSEKTFLTDGEWNEKTLEDSRTMHGGEGTYLGKLLKIS